MTSDEINLAIAEGHSAYASTIERNVRTVRVLKTRWKDHALQAQIVHPVPADRWRTWVEINAFTVSIKLREVAPNIAATFSEYIAGQYAAGGARH